MKPEWSKSTFYSVAVASTLWLLAIMTPSLTRLWSSPLGALSYLFFAPVCHQLPERSFHLLGAQLAVCHRCFGIYAGFWTGLLLLPWFPRIGEVLLRNARLLLLFALPMLINVFLPNYPLDRFFTGFLAGFPVPIFVLIAVDQVLAVARGGLNESGRAR